MSLPNKVLLPFTAGALATAASVSANQVLNDGQWNLWWLTGSIVLAALSAAFGLWFGNRNNADNIGQSVKPALSPDMKDVDGTPFLLSEVSVSDLGVQPSRFSSEGVSPYISRKADDLLAAALTNGEKRVIIVQGPRLAGATRTLARAAQINLHDHLAVRFTDDPRVSLASMIAQARIWAEETQARASGAVVWLERLGPDRFTELAHFPPEDLPPCVWILATLDTSELEGPRIPAQLNMRLDQTAFRVQLGVITEKERRDLIADKSYTVLRPALSEAKDLFMGRLMVAWVPLRKALARGDSEQAAERVALLRAVTDWYRLQLPRLLSIDVLSHIYRAYRHEITGAAADSPVSAAEFGEALQWATAAPTAERPRLVDLENVSGGQRYIPHPLLAVIADDAHEDVSWPVSDVIWFYSDRYFHGDQRRDIGYAALTRGAVHAAARLLSHTDTAVDPAAYYRIGTLFYEHGECGSSRKWWQKAVNTGDSEVAPGAMYDLGNLEAAHGNPDQARDWYHQAIATGRPDMAPKAMCDLGSLEAEQGNLGAARDWCRQAIATSHTDAVPNAMGILGSLETEQGNLGAARDWYQQAIATGHPDAAPGAMYDLGNLEAKRGDTGAARDWYQQAIATGHPKTTPKAMGNLGNLEAAHGNPDQARDWYQQAIATGSPDMAPITMYNLGNLEAEQGNPDQARDLYQQVTATGHPDMAARAMYSLADLEAEHGSLDQAQDWYQQAIATGHPETAPKAMCNLAILEADHGNPGAARDRYQQAIATRHPEAAPKAMYNLANLEAEQGNLGAARDMYQQATSAGHPEIATHAQQKLRALDRHESDRRRGEHFGRYGYLAYADTTLMKPEADLN